MCAAVGFTGSCFEGGCNKLPLAAVWNGVDWTFSKPHISTTYGMAQLNGIDCYAAFQCLAVGEEYPSKYVCCSVSMGYALELTGKVWTQVGNVNPSPVSDGFTAVACPAKGMCYAGGSVGSANHDMHTGTFVGTPATYQPLIEQFTGHDLAHPEVMTGINAPLTGLSCVQEGYCWGTLQWNYGGYPSANVLNSMLVFTPYAREVVTVSPHTTPGISFTDLSCADTGYCLAYGLQSVKTNTYPVLIETGKPLTNYADFIPGMIALEIDIVLLVWIGLDVAGSHLRR